VLAEALRIASGIHYGEAIVASIGATSFTNRLGDRRNGQHLRATGGPDTGVRLCSHNFEACG
jgi:hypothetical protein